MLPIGQSGRPDQGKSTGWRLKIQLGTLGPEPLHKEAHRTRGSSSPTYTLSLTKPHRPSSPNVELSSSGSA